MYFTLTDDERAVMETAVSVAGAADPWAALEEGGWLDILLEDEQGMAYLGLMAEALGSAGVSVPLVGTAVVWPTCCGGSAGGRRVGVADAAAGPAGRRRPEAGQRAPSTTVCCVRTESEPMSSWCSARTGPGSTRCSPLNPKAAWRATGSHVSGWRAEPWIAARIPTSWPRPSAGRRRWPPPRWPGRSTGWLR